MHSTDLWTRLGYPATPSSAWRIARHASIKYADFRQTIRALSGERLVNSRAAVENAAFRLLAALAPDPRVVRLLGVACSSLTTGGEHPEPEVGPQLALSL